MKKIIYCALALAAGLFASSCQQENLEPVAQENTVAFTVETPAALQTKAIADGMNVDKLIYEVWLTPTLGDLTTSAQKLYQETQGMYKDGGENKTIITLDLVNDQKYTILLWAQVDGTGVYNTTELNDVHYNSTEAGAYAANDERLAAFYGVAYVNDGNPVNKDGSKAPARVELRRPFAQVNLGTLNTSTEQGSKTGYTIDIKESNMILRNVPTHFNVVNGMATKPAEMEFLMYNAPCKDLTSADAKLPGFTNPEYYYAGMNYVFASNEETGITAELEYNIKAKLNGGSEVVVNNTIPNVPLKENYRTNIIGNLLTSSTDYEVVIDANFNTNNNSGNIEVVGEGIVKNMNGDYEITNVYGFAYAINNLFADGGTFYIHPGRYDFTGIAVEPKVTEDRVILNVKANEVPVVTRSTTPEFEIIGLNVPLVAKVSENSQALFSNIVLPEDTKLVGTNNGVVGISGCSNEETDTPTELIGEGDGAVVNTVSMATVADINAAIEAGLTLIELTADITGLTEIFTISKPVTIDGCGYKLTSTAGRAINVDGEDANGVTIKNLTIEATGERAINVINKATNVTIDNVTATAANYTVNVAGTAPNAVVAIKNSILNGLNTVNVGAPKVKVTVNNSTVNCNDNNTTAGEAYSALCLNKAAVGAEIIATNTVVNVTEGSDSSKGRNGAEDGTVTINGSTEGVTITVAVITYPESDYYYGFETVASAIEFAKETDVISLIRNISVEETIVVNDDKTVTIDLNGKTLTGPNAAKDAEGNRIHVLKNNGTLTIKNGTINSIAINGGSAILNNGELTLNNVTVNGAPSDTATDDYASYAVNSQGAGSELVVNNSTINGRGAVGATKGTKVVLNGGTYHTPAVAWGHAVYATNEGTEVVINGGTFSEGYEMTANNWGMYQIYSGDKAKVTVNGGDFSQPWDCANGYDLCTATEGTIEIYGGTFAENPSSQNGKNYVAWGYKAVKKDNATYTVQEMTPIAQIGNVLYESLQEAIDKVNEGETILLCEDVKIATPAYGQNALNYARAINFTLDLNGKTLSANTGNSVFRYNITQAGATDDVTVTLKNGTITADGNTWCVVMAAGLSEDVRAVFNLENLTINASKPGDLAVKAWDYALINAKNVTVNATNGAGGFYAVGGEIVLDNCTVNQEGLWTAPYLSMAVAVSTGGKATVNSGTYTAVPTAASEGYNQGTSHGSWAAGVMNSGGELIINGGTFANGNFGDDALATAARGLIFGDTASKIVINNGTFNALKSIIDYQNNLGVQPNPNIVINGGNFSADPSVVTSYGGVVIKEGFTPIQGTDGRWTLVKAQPNTEIWYTGDMKLEPTNPDALNANILSNVWDASIGKYVMTFDAPLTTIGNEAFKRITNTTPSNWMTSISLPNSVKTIGNYAFAQCYSLTEITIPDSVETIGEYAFQSCNAATKVTIGSGVETIASAAFYNCYEIKEITCKSTTPPVVADEWVFNGAEITKVVVPAASVDAYKAADVWKNFNIVAE